MTSHFFSSRFFNPCWASQLLFSLHAPLDSLLSFFFSIFHSLRGISASFPSPCPVRSSSFPFLLNFSLSAGHLSFFFLSMPRPKLFFLFSSQFFALCGAPQLLFLSMPRLMHWFSDYKAAMPAGSAHTQPTSKNSYLLRQLQSPSHWLSVDLLP